MQGPWVTFFAPPPGHRDRHGNLGIYQRARIHIGRICRNVTLGLGVALFGGGAVWANPLLIGESEREAWQAIGQLRIHHQNRKGICTGILITPTQVLTAAHCVTSTKSGNPFPAYRVSFVAGWHFGEQRGNSGAKAIHVHPDYDPKAIVKNKNIPLENIATDLAVVDLMAPLKKVTPARMSAAPSVSGPVAILGYRRDQPEALSDYVGCQATLPARNMIGLQCRVIAGTSGAPVLQSAKDGGWSVIGIVSAQSGGKGPVRGLAAVANIDRLQDILQDTSGIDSDDPVVD